MKIIITFLFSIFIVYVQSQLKNYPDCKDAQLLNISKEGKIGIFPTPKGSGELAEMNSSKKNNYYFEKEHNTSWFKFGTSVPRKLIFEIIPVNPKDDYDFILFKVDPKKDICEQIKMKKNKPVRSNIARGDTIYKGKTGLTLKAQNDFKTSGKGYPFSSYIDILPGEFYYLVIDKYNDSEFGFSINLNFEKEVLIKGNIKDESQKSILSEITLTNNKGEEVFKTNSNNKGNFEIKTVLNKNEDYLITAYNDSCFLESTIINTSKIKENNEAFQNISFVLPKLKKGKKFIVNNLNFHGDSDKLLSKSIPIQENLYKLMLKNKKLKINIEGHVNGPNSPNIPQHIELSKKRSEAVYNYLLSKGINENRLSKEWFGNSKMLYPTTNDEKEMELNRRVEIKVVDF